MRRVSHPFTVARYPGFLLAWSQDWPGLLSGAATHELLTESLPRALVEFRAWLESHGESGPEGVAWHTSETLDGAAFDRRDACHPADRAPLSQAEFEQYLRHIQLAQDDLLKAAALPAELLDWRPRGLAVENPDPWAPDARTIRGILIHALQFEIFYREGLRDGGAAGIFEPVASPPEETARTREVLATASVSDINRLFHPQRPHASLGLAEPGEWTVRKTLRRLISHNRAHAAEILQRRTWVLLGAPAGAEAQG